MIFIIVKDHCRGEGTVIGYVGNIAVLMLTLICGFSTCIDVMPLNDMMDNDNNASSEIRFLIPISSKIQILSKIFFVTQSNIESLEHTYSGYLLF